jgi:hypothetical protein
MQYDEIIKPLGHLMTFLVSQSEISYLGMASHSVPLALRVQMRDAMHFREFGGSRDLLQPSQILGHIRLCEASNARDKIYALYALFLRIGFQLPQPNYNNTVEKVYWDAATSTMTYEQSLEILLLANGRRMEGAPSWVPDFREFVSPATYLNKEWEATENSSAYFLLSSDEAILNVRGCVIDTVSLVLAAHPWKQPRFDMEHEDQAFLDLKDGFQSIINCLQLRLYFCYINEQSRYGSREEKEAACMDVLSRGIMSSLGDNLAFQLWTTLLSITHTDEEDGPRYLETLVEIGKQKNPMLWSQFSDDSELRHLTDMDQWKILFAITTSVRVAVVHKCVLEMSNDSNIFWTESGYLGQGSVEMREGDVIALIQGLRMPMIFRPSLNESSPERYSVVSPAYISGMMKGELWEETVEQLVQVSLE